jgi:hypothetical protein
MIKKGSIYIAPCYTSANLDEKFNNVKYTNMLEFTNIDKEKLYGIEFYKRVDEKNFNSAKFCGEMISKNKFILVSNEVIFNCKINKKKTKIKVISTSTILGFISNVTYYLKK